MHFALLLTAAATAGAAATVHVHDPIGSVQGLIGRLLGPQYVPAFVLETIPIDPATGHDVFELDAQGAPAAAVVIRGNSGVAIASGLHWYLKYWCNASVAWGKGGSGNQLATVPAPARLPLPAPQRSVSLVRVRYAMNVCTYGYTQFAWTFDRAAPAPAADAFREPCNASCDAADTAAAAAPSGSSITWREELDRLALWGVSLPLAFIGQEWVFLQTYEGAGLPAAAYVDDYLSGPAFLPWQRMGNIQRLDNAGNGSMLPWITQQRDLQLQWLAAARLFGMQPVLPGWAGHVPSGLVALFPNASFTQNTPWDGFNGTYSGDWLLQPLDPLFQTLGAAYYRNLVAAYGVNPGGAANYYNADVFNEMVPRDSDPAYLNATNVAIYTAMSSVDPAGVFVMQGWLFLTAWWSYDRIEAFLGGVPDARMLILDLFTDSVPIWSQTKSYFGKPWVWNTLLVFGGRRGIYGNLTRVGVQPFLDLAAPGSTMVGLGITPEATEMGLPVFDLFWDIAWRAQPVDVGAWVAGYATRRYGAASPLALQAWALLERGAYNVYYDYETTTHFCPLTDTPQLALPAARDGTDWAAVVAAFRLLAAAGAGGEVDAAGTPTFRYDLVDVGRQMLCNVFTDLAGLAGAEYLRGAAAGTNTSGAVQATQAALAALISDMDALLSTDTNFLLGHWLRDAALWAGGGGARAAQQLDSDARNLITLWGFSGSQIEDYAAKNWFAGLVRDYYGSRWALHGAYVARAAASGQPVDWAGYTAELATLETRWVAGAWPAEPYPVTPTGDTLAQAQGVLRSWASGAAAYAAVADCDAAPHAGAPITALFSASNTDAGVLAALCNADPACLGFSSAGVLRNDTRGLAPAAGITLYLKPTNADAAAAGLGAVPCASR